MSLPRGRASRTLTLLAVLQTGLSTLPQRWKGAIAVVAALAVVTMVMNPLLIFVDSFTRSNMSMVAPLRAIVSHRLPYSDNPIPDAWLAIIKTAPGIARMPDGSPMASAETETSMSVHAPTCCSPCPDYCPHVIAIEPAGFTMRSELRLLSGRLPRPGSNEIIVGEQVLRLLPHLKIGGILRNNYLQPAGALAENPRLKSDATVRSWKITGFFSTGSISWDLRVFGDYQAFLQADPMRYTSRVRVRLASAESFSAFQAALRAHPEMNIRIEREADYYARVTDSSGAARTAAIVAHVLGTLVGIGAFTGVLHVVRGTLETRAREIAVLRVIGFDGLSIALSLALEAILLAALGALLGMLALYLWYEGRLFGGGQIATLSPSVVGFALLWAIAIALLGTLFPALRTARQTPLEALREV